MNKNNKENLDEERWNKIVLGFLIVAIVIIVYGIIVLIDSYNTVP